MRTVSGIVPVLFLIVLSVCFCVRPSLVRSEEWIYTVQQGDNFWTISRKNLRSVRYWRKLAALNSVGDSARLLPGSTIRIPVEWLKKGASVARIIAVSGEAVVLRNNTETEIAAVAGMFLWGNDRVQTAAGSNVTLKFADDSEVLVQSESEIVLGKLMRYGSTGMTETNVLLKSGRTHNKIIPRSGPGSRFEIKTPSAVAAVRGTEYRVGSKPDGSSRIEVLAGSVRLDSSGVTGRLKNGYGSITFPDYKPLPPIKLLPPPELSRIGKEIFQVPFPLKLQPVPGASCYRLQIAATRDFCPLLYDRTFRGTNLWGPDLPNGEYFLRVNGIDNIGLEGFYSIHRFHIAAHPLSPVPLSPAADAVMENCQPHFRWSRPKEAEHYHFQLAKDEGFTSLLVNVDNLEQPQYSVRKQPLPGSYYWRLASVDSAENQGPYSAPQKILCPPPGPDMSAARLDMEQMVYRWPGSTKNRYRFQVAHDEFFSRPFINQELAEPEFSLQALTPGNYYCRVATIAPDGLVGPFSTSQSVTVDSTLANPLLSIGGSILPVLMMIFL